MEITNFIDELISPVIKELNNKGYITKYSCSGHSYNWQDIYVDTYITFKGGCVPNSLPREFTLEDKIYYNKQGWGEYFNCDNMTIRKTYHNISSELELHKQILLTILDLLSWVETLENNT